MPETIGLKQRIREAKSANEVNILLTEGKAYKFVSDRTVRQWLRISDAKLKAFKQEKTDAKKKGNS